MPHCKTAAFPLPLGGGGESVDVKAHPSELVMLRPSVVRY